jgi:hypothetical protein
MNLYRRIDDQLAKWWEDHFKNANPVPADDEMPVWAITPFLMTADELKSGGGISFFAASSKDELEMVAAALSVKQSIDSSFFVGVAKADIERSGIEIAAVQGITYVPLVDSQHFEIKATQLNQICRLASLFLAGNVEKVQKARAANVRDSFARKGGIEFKRLANDNKQIGNQRLLRFVSAEHVLVTGADQQ